MEDITRLVEERGFELVETHISWVLLGKEHVFKIKKPVKFSFLDFSTLEKRKFFCEEEVRLNSRLAPEVYLGVVPVVEKDGTLSLEGEGKVVNYAVKMVRLDHEKSMRKLLAEGKVGEDTVRRLAVKIADFHDKVDRTPGYGMPETVGGQIVDLGNHKEAIEKAAGLGSKVDFVLERSAAFIDKNRELLERRSRDGMVRDCHGDLHSGNVFLYDGIKIIDCIEFSKDFRNVDVVSDIAFMAMDLDYAGQEKLSTVFVDEYTARSGDDSVTALLNFYKCYRANVRAKIAALELGVNDDAKERIERYLALAVRYAERL